MQRLERRDPNEHHTIAGSPPLRPGPETVRGTDHANQHVQPMSEV